MRTTLEADRDRLLLEFPDPEALRSFLDEWKRREGFLVQLAEEQKLWRRFTVVLRQGATRLEVAARVVQVFGGGDRAHATAFQAADAAALAALEVPGAEAADAAPAGEIQGASPALRIRQLNVSEKMHLATKAGRTERQILLRDSSPQVLMGLLANPRIEDKEVLAICKSSSASSGVLQRIAKDRRWSANYEVRLALVKNPQTPSPLALRMLDTLREKDLRVLAKGSHVREAIRGAALRLVIKRGR